jgi:diaminohydroxyphosphoribosylaminopyrimidine deaminase / 5-amino-6-(5-phosphoribosylamino)uracil reductase
VEEEIMYSLSQVFKGKKLSIDQAMALAVEIGHLGASYVAPNPLVGCVILDSEGGFLSAGYHEKYGEAHAEINALKTLSNEELKDATVVVTLEPCAHVGKTGSCAIELSKYKIRKVIYGLVDPNPMVRGKGAEFLNKAGIATKLYQGPAVSDLENLAEVFLKNFRYQKPFVAMKAASSLDGQMALKTGESQWITTPESREYVHELRSHYDAIVVGRKTIEQDNPSLNIRHPKIVKKNKVIVFDPQGVLIKKIDAGVRFKFLDLHAPEDVYFAVQSKVLTVRQTIEFSSMNNFLDLVFKLNIKSLFVEGGAGTYSSFLNQDLVDRIHLFINPSIVGSDTGISWSAGFGIKKLDEKVVLRDLQTRTFGSDIYLTGRL